MRCILLYNPNSGKGKLHKKLLYIQKKLREKFDEVVVQTTSSAEDFEHRVRMSAEEYDCVLFSGGDGTFHHVIQALRGKRASLGYLPSGTVNDVARSLKIPRTVRGALKVILKGEPQNLDCMEVNGSQYAMYIAAAGAFTRATYATPQNKKRLFGALAYAVEAVLHDLKLQVFPLKIECGEQTLETHAVLILVMNGTSVAGFPLNRKGSMTDGKLEIAVIRQVKRPNFFQKIGALFSVASLFVFGCKIKKRDVAFFSGEEVRIRTSEDVVWDFDGEEGIKGNVTVKACPERITLFVPKK